MVVKFRVRLLWPNAPDIHQSRNFAEDMLYRFERAGTGRIENLDTMIDEFFVIVDNRRLLGKVQEQMRKAIDEFRKDVSIEVERL